VAFVVEKGTATLYSNNSTIENRGAGTQVTFTDYYIIRKGEAAARLISEDNNKTFNTEAPVYFQDYPELVAKIRAKEYTRKNLVVQEYNKWAERKGK
jgi:hypothetical protein